VAEVTLRAVYLDARYVWPFRYPLDCVFLLHFGFIIFEANASAEFFATHRWGEIWHGWGDRSSPPSC